MKDISLVDITSIFYSIGSMNLVDLVVRIDTIDLSSSFVECAIFQPGYTCTIDYGTDPSYTNLVYRDTSYTDGRTATITLSQRLRGDTTYYYTVSAESNSCCVRVRGRFQPGRNKSFGVCQQIRGEFYMTAFNHIN